MAAFDPEIHELDSSGFQRHKETGHLVGIEQMPPRAVAHADYPKWVKPHHGHIKHHPLTGQTTTPAWGVPHIDREGEISVLVESAEDEARALAEPPSPELA